MQQCLEILYEKNYYIVFDIEERKINACFEYVTDAISHLNRYGMPQKHRLIEPSTYFLLSLKEVNLENFKKINIKEVLVMIKSSRSS